MLPCCAVPGSLTGLLKRHPKMYCLLNQRYHSLGALGVAVYDNQLEPGKSLSLSGYESYRQVLQCLLDKAFRGLQVHSPEHTSAIFKTEERMKSVVTVPWK